VPRPERSHGRACETQRQGRHQRSVHVLYVDVFNGGVDVLNVGVCIGRWIF
jgi:hypothetical protein